MSWRNINSSLSKALSKKIVNVSPNIRLTSKLGAQLPKFNVAVAFNSTKKSGLGQTTILMQDGSDIQELPAIVRKVTGNEALLLYKNDTENDNSTEPELPLHESNAEFIDLLKKAESEEVILGLNRCFSTKNIFALLETLPANEVTPSVALQALKKTIYLENNIVFRNRAMVKTLNDKPDTFTRTAVLNQLINIILSSSDSEILLEGLKTVTRDYTGGNTTACKEKLRDEVLCRVTDGKFTLKQSCDVIKVFSNLGNIENTDKLWLGITEKQDDIDENTIMLVFRILPLLKQSRKIVLNILEKRLVKVWWHLDGKNISEILSILEEVHSSSPRILDVISRWINTNIHTLSEHELMEIVNGLWDLDYNSQGVNNALERYIKVKGVQVRNPLLIAYILDYCAKFRFHSAHILQGGAEYIIAHGVALSPVMLKSIFTSIAHLNYHPSNAILFWKTLETAFESRFVQFRPEDAMDMLLGCVYLEKHPLNFVKKVFNPYFLDRLHSSCSKESIRVVRAKLKVLDTAMTLECDQYQGPLLPKEHDAKSVWQDGRVKRILSSLESTLTSVVGDADRVTYSVVLPQLPLSELYILDALIHPARMATSMLRNLNFQRDRNVYIGLLVHLPEHYCCDSAHLIGPQVMRKRHLRKIGLRVVTLDYDKLVKLKKHPLELKRYIDVRFHAAEEAV